MSYLPPNLISFKIFQQKKKKKEEKKRNEEEKKKKKWRRKKSFFFSYPHIFILFLSIFTSSKIHLGLSLLFVFFSIDVDVRTTTVSPPPPKCIHSIFYVHSNLLHMLQWIITVVQYQNPKHSVCIYTVSITTQHV